jgi:hypothetical protein
LTGKKIYWSVTFFRLKMMVQIKHKVLRLYNLKIIKRNPWTLHVTQQKNSWLRTSKSFAVSILPSIREPSNLLQSQKNKTWMFRNYWKISLTAWKIRSTRKKIRKRSNRAVMKTLTMIMMRSRIKSMMD